MKAKSWKTRQLTVCQKYRYNMKKDLSQLEIQTLYNRILNDGVSELDGIKPFEIRQIFDYAKNINEEAVKFCVGLLELNQNYNYPPEYPEDKRLEYWIRKYPNYSKSKYAMDLLNDKFKEVKSISKESISKRFNGFQSGLNDVQIEYLFEKLKGNYIDKKTDEDNFKAIFKNDALPKDCKIHWLKSNVLLAYLVKKLFHTDNYLDVWAKAENIFGVKNLNKSECNNPKPKGYESLDLVLKSMDNHLQ